MHIASALKKQEEVRNALLAAMPVANAAAEDRHITTPKAAAVIKTSISLTNSPSNNIHSRQVLEVYQQDLAKL